jgi:pimeloyl-ACP methyl ester carboxylesterase
MMPSMEKQELVLTNRDGKRMPALLRLPDGEAKGTVMFLHGLGGWKDQPILKYLAEHFQKSGYVAFASDDSNGVLSPDGKFFDSTQTSYERDIADAVGYVKAAPWYRAPLLLIGHSMGGLAAIDYAAAHPDDASEVVLLAPAVSWKSMWYVQLPFALISLLRGHETVLGVDNRRFVLGAGWWKDFFSYDAFRSAPKVKARTLIISAERDFTVAKPDEHRRLTRRFPNAEHSTITWADHDFNGQEKEVAATINQWLTSS